MPDNPRGLTPNGQWSAFHDDCLGWLVHRTTVWTNGEAFYERAPTGPYASEFDAWTGAVHMNDEMGAVQASAA